MSTQFAEKMRATCGTPFPSAGIGFDSQEFFRVGEMRDVLDGITVMADVLNGFPIEARKWISFCKAAFEEEGMAYRIDDKGKAHYVVDVAFQEMADAVIAKLSGGRYTAAGACANKAVSELTKANPDGKHAIRDIFEGVETAFKVTADTNKDLTQPNIASWLTPIVNRRFEGADAIAQGAAAQTLESLKDWTAACHKYRHGHNADEPVEPPLELAIVLVGNGLNFARWIASLGA
jgi:hypothetical protein